MNNVRTLPIRSQHRRQQDELAAQGHRSYRAAFARIGKKPPEEQPGVAAWASAIKRGHGTVGVPAQDIHDENRARMAAMQAAVANTRRLFPRGAA